MRIQCMLWPGWYVVPLAHRIAYISSRTMIIVFSCPSVITLVSRVFGFARLRALVYNPYDTSKTKRKAKGES